MKKLAIAFTGAVLACLAVAPSAGAVENSAAAENSAAGVQTFYDCGFLPAYKTPGNHAWYNHCGNSPVKIIVENVFFVDREKCVPGGITDIEGWSGGYTTRDAWYVSPC